MEKWKIIDVKGFEDIYEISNMGRVRRLRDNKLMALKTTNTGYTHIGLRKKGQRKWCAVHRLVATHFIENPENKPEVNHKNGVKSDNRTYNLEWVTKSENKIHAYETGLWEPVNRKSVRNKTLDKVFTSSFQAAQWLNETKFGSKRTIKNLARDVRACASGDQYTAHGYKWEFVKNL